MSSSSFKAGSCLVCLPLLLICCGSYYVEGQANFSWEYVARDMMLPLVAPFGAVARKSGCLFGDGWKYQDDPDEKPRRPPFPFFNAWEIGSSMDPILTLVKDELSRYVENLSPFVYSKEVIENNVVRSHAEFCGLLESKQVSAKKSFRFFYLM